MTHEDRLRGALLGVAVGDALGLPYEGLSIARVARRFGRGGDVASPSPTRPRAPQGAAVGDARASVLRYRLVGRTGFVSDDTEQSALLAQSLLRGGGDDDACVAAFRRALRGWFARLPFGIGGATLRACLRMCCGLRRSGVSSAGNGAAMRAGILGAWHAHDPARRRRLGVAIASLTHTDARAIEAALFVAEVAAGCVGGDAAVDRHALVRSAREVVAHAQLREALNRASELAAQQATVDVAAAALGNVGFAPCPIGLCTFAFLRFGDRPLDAIRAGGDTDTHAAIVGGWVGALHGAATWPAHLVDALHDGPFGPTHLRGLAQALTAGGAPPRWSWLYAMARNLALYPVVLAHGFARLVPR